jgi:hypothetical protein
VVPSSFLDSQQGHSTFIKKYILRKSTILYPKYSTRDFLQQGHEQHKKIKIIAGVHINAAQ